MFLPVGRDVVVNRDLLEALRRLDLDEGLHGFHVLIRNRLPHRLALRIRRTVVLLLKFGNLVHELLDPICGDFERANGFLVLIILIIICLFIIHTKSVKIKRHTSVLGAKACVRA